MTTVLLAPTPLVFRRAIWPAAGFFNAPNALGVLLYSDELAQVNARAAAEDLDPAEWLRAAILTTLKQERS